MLIDAALADLDSPPPSSPCPTIRPCALPAHWWILVLALVLAVLAGTGWLHNRQQRTRWEAVDKHAKLRADRLILIDNPSTWNFTSSRR